MVRVDSEEKHTRVELAGDLTAMRIARAAVHDLLDVAPIGFVSDALLLTSELVSNAVLHVGGSIALDARFDGEALVVSVRDRSAALPQAPSVTSPWSSQGRGLSIVRTIADDWGASADDTGKTVWFRLERQPSSSRC